MSRSTGLTEEEDPRDKTLCMLLVETIAPNFNLL